MVVFPKGIADLNDLLESFEVTSRALDREQRFVLGMLAFGQLSVPSEFIGMTQTDVLLRFDLYIAEIEFGAILSMVASIEAQIKADYRLRRKRKGNFRVIKEQQGSKPRLQDLLSAWRVTADGQGKPELRKEVDAFADTLKLRHWIAHGRAFDVTTRIKYSPGKIYAIGIVIEQMIAEL
jgi:hypothetical protein